MVVTVDKSFVEMFKNWIGHASPFLKRHAIPLIVIPEFADDSAGVILPQLAELQNLANSTAKQRFRMTQEHKPVPFSVFDDREYFKGKALRQQEAGRHIKG